jgi:phosphohistidine phosphatase SixA
MSKRLIIMRHAKSSWKSSAATDHQRPLNKRGRHDAPRIGARLQELGWIPDLVIASDSERTRETWQRMQAEFPVSIKERFNSDFYHGGLADIASACTRLTGDISTLLVLGHNPGWEDAVANLSGQWVRMTTANAALLESGAEDWATAMDADWLLVDVLRPKEL